MQQGSAKNRKEKKIIQQTKTVIVGAQAPVLRRVPGGPLQRVVATLAEVGVFH
jgi:hypothetical protein